MLRLNSHPGIDMAQRSFIFCDICNPLAIRYIEMRRSAGRDSRLGRRVTDGRNWFDGSEEQAERAGWVATEDGQHVCPDCFTRMKSMRHLLDQRLQTVRSQNAGHPEAAPCGTEHD
jgi:hypothetical protein